MAAVDVSPTVSSPSKEPATGGVSIGRSEDQVELYPLLEAHSAELDVLPRHTGRELNGRVVAKALFHGARSQTRIRLWRSDAQDQTGRVSPFRGPCIQSGEHPVR